jgi:hypothetical protein
MRYVMGLVLILAVSAGCSRNPDRAVVDTPSSPTASVADPTMSVGRGVFGTMAVTFPATTDPTQFAIELESKYQNGLGRPATQTYVDPEGAVVWVQEYIRYRVQACDHATAVQRIRAQIGGASAAAACGAEQTGQIAIPSHSDLVDFKRTLETIYQTQLGRGPRATFVDLEGSVIWIAEYLGYRINGCDHATAVLKVFTRIDTGTIPASCYVACSYRITPDTVTLGVGSLNSTFEIRPNPVACEYTLSSNASWLTFPSDQRVGNGFFNIPYSVASNLGNADRTGVITATWSGGSATFTVRQTGSPYAVSFTLVDGFRSVNSTTQCHIRSSTTPCTFTASTNLPGNNVTYTWAAFYNYGNTAKVVRQASTSNVFVVSDSCGGQGSSAGGEEYGLTVELRVEDDRGNVITIASGQGSQPSLLMKMFTCGS